MLEELKKQVYESEYAASAVPSGDVYLGKRQRH